ncbi:hypothetical protein DFH11DRAFT_1540333 [Phellopilus nigrolimitatus]|nr:hypothetical protein DFH11DRAFT_1540333 [Phellopilus nigrolimitatus]
MQRCSLGLEMAMAIWARLGCARARMSFGDLEFAAARADLQTRQARRPVLLLLVVPSSAAFLTHLWAAARISTGLGPVGLLLCCMHRPSTPAESAWSETQARGRGTALLLRRSRHFSVLLEVVVRRAWRGAGLVTSELRRGEARRGEATRFLGRADLKYKSAFPPSSDDGQAGASTARHGRAPSAPRCLRVCGISNEPAPPREQGANDDEQGAGARRVVALCPLRFGRIQYSKGRGRPASGPLRECGFLSVVSEHKSRVAAERALSPMRACCACPPCTRALQAPPYGRPIR